MAVKEKVPRGANQALFSYLPGQLVEYPNANAVVLVNKWGSRPSNIESKKRILDKIYNALSGYSSKYCDIDRAYPKTPKANLFYFGEPNRVFCQLFPLVFTEESTNQAFIFKKVKRTWNLKNI